MLRTPGRRRMVRDGRIWAMALVATLLTIGSAGSAPAAVQARQAAGQLAIAGSGPGGSNPNPGIPYCPGVGTGEASDVMDIFTPAGAVAGDAFPALLWVHGGGWETGNSMDGSGDTLGTDGYSIEVATGLLNTGKFVVASIDYRLAMPQINPPGNQFPDQIVDVNCAIRYLRAHASTYFIDTNHIFAMGGSAGGHLVSLAGLAPASAGFECQNGDTTDWCSQSSALQAVVDEWGVSDFTDPAWGQHASQVIQQVFGHAPGVDNPIMERASPVTYIATGDPPFLIVQGDEDPLNPQSQAAELGQRLSMANDPPQLYLVHHAVHGVLEPGEQPGIGQLVQAIVSFLEAEAGS
ncbi:MAG TPA: alpha/beta hydrolase [Streptosporangiaceae bacterium]|nr:alpha/beta hydrolase [Streptosporangiaceae bacterium]